MIGAVRFTAERLLNLQYRPGHCHCAEGHKAQAASPCHRPKVWRNLAEKQERRNDGLNYSAWKFSQFIESGELDRLVAAKLLWLACKANGYLKVDGPDVVREVIGRVLKWQRE